MQTARPTQHHVFRVFCSFGDHRPGLCRSSIAGLFSRVSIAVQSTLKMKKIGVALIPKHSGRAEGLKEQDVWGVSKDKALPFRLSCIPCVGGSGSRNRTNSERHGADGRYHLLQLQVLHCSLEHVNSEARALLLSLLCCSQGCRIPAIVPFKAGEMRMGLPQVSEPT